MILSRLPATCRLHHCFNKNLPLLIGTGQPPWEVAPNALASTFVTSVAGVITFLILSVHHHGPVAPSGRPA
jgi:hypothetical protein